MKTPSFLAFAIFLLVSGCTGGPETLSTPAYRVDRMLKREAEKQAQIAAENLRCCEEAALKNVSAWQFCPGEPRTDLQTLIPFAIRGR